MIRLVLLAALLLIAGCEKEPLSRAVSTNREIPVDRLFEIDGCRVYRFYDGRSRYFASCAGVTSGSHTEPCGKNCLRTVPDEIPTGVRSE
jgi:hypothetical protein